ncbi:MAG: FIST C-terminal domain-containing protein [Rhizobiales bacterium]|nr:FIST C-terminal domain-containing protein [Hyphomicrobiales bacterium]
MQVSTFNWDGTGEFSPFPNMSTEPDLVIYFGDSDCVENVHHLLRGAAKNALVIGCSTGGQFSHLKTYDNNLVYSALSFADTKIRAAHSDLTKTGCSYACAKDIATTLKADDLAAVLVLSDGTSVNGSELAQGFSDALGSDIPVIGGLAGDGDRFNSTLVGLNDLFQPNMVAAIGFYGDAIQIGHGSKGGWKPFGPRRMVTKSHKNVLLELDGQPALDLYENYLGDEAKDLPASALLYPLQVTARRSNSSDADATVVRTILNIDREAKSLIFAGNISEGSTAQLMRASQSDLTLGAANAAQAATLHNPDDGFALMVSCIGRRLLMGQRAEEEVEAAQENLRPNQPNMGFYSYGEICPNEPGGVPLLHNQTMTISVLSESLSHAA